MQDSGKYVQLIKLVERKISKLQKSMKNTGSFVKLVNMSKDNRKIANFDKNSRKLFAKKRIHEQTLLFFSDFFMVCVHWIIRMRHRFCFGDDEVDEDGLLLTPIGCDERCTD